jgi:NADH-quinone oxidoreductase subunit B
MSTQSLQKEGKGDIIVAPLNKLLNWARSTSPWYFQFGLACCAIEMMATAASRHDLERIGMMPRSSPRQADVMIVSGTVTLKMALRVKRLYEQMAEPKYVIAMGSCATSGGPYWQYGYHVLKGVDLVVPVDVYVPGCPPRPETLLEGLLKLQEKIRQERPIQDTVAGNLKRMFSRKKGRSIVTPVDSKVVTTG